MTTEEDYLTVIKLLQFYNVKTEGKLILAMYEHIARLQEKLNEVSPIIERRAIGKLSDMLNSAGVNAFLVPKSKSAEEWEAFRLRVAKEIHDRLTEKQK